MRGAGGQGPRLRRQPQARSPRGPAGPGREAQAPAASVSLAVAPTWSQASPREPLAVLPTPLPSCGSSELGLMRPVHGRRAVLRIRATSLRVPLAVAMSRGWNLAASALAQFFGREQLLGHCPPDPQPPAGPPPPTLTASCLADKTRKPHCPRPLAWPPRGQRNHRMPSEMRGLGHSLPEGPAAGPAPPSRGQQAAHLQRGAPVGSARTDGHRPVPRGLGPLARCGPFRLPRAGRSPLSTQAAGGAGTGSPAGPVGRSAPVSRSPEGRRRPRARVWAACAEGRVGPGPVGPAPRPRSVCRLGLTLPFLFASLRPEEEG